MVKENKYDSGRRYTQKIEGMCKHLVSRTRAKMVMYILYNYKPDKLLEDYSFRSKEGKTINIKVSMRSLNIFKPCRIWNDISRLLKYGLPISRKADW